MLLNNNNKSTGAVDLRKHFISSYNFASHIYRYLCSHAQMLADASAGRMRVFNDDILKFNMEKIFPESMKRPWEDGKHA